MSTGNIFASDLYHLHGIVSNPMITYPKEIIIATLRDFFSHDTTYHYVKDRFGNTLTTDHTDQPLDAGLNDNTSTRLNIGENYRYDVIYYPSILVKNNGSRSIPIGINRETGKVQWTYRAFEDGYGNLTKVRTPQAFIFNGAWEGGVTIDVKTRSLRSRDELVQLVGICLTHLSFESLRKAGIIVKPIVVGSPTEILDRNDNVFQQSITLDIRSQWEVQIPISNVIEAISFSIEFGRTDIIDAPIAQNLTITTEMSFLDIMAGI